MGDHLLCSQRKACGFFGWQREGLIAGIRMQRLTPPENGREGLKRHAHNIVVDLLRCQCRSPGLSMKPELHGILLLRPETVLHNPGPEAAGCAEFRDLFGEIVVGVAEERELS